MEREEREVDLIHEKQRLEAENPRLTQGFFQFVESFRKYKEMQQRVVAGGGAAPVSARAKR